MGTIIKRDKYYSIVYDEPKGSNGQRQQVMKSVRKLGGSGTNYKEAQTILAEVERKIRLGEYAVSDHTVESYLREWLTGVAKSLEASTYRNYDSDCRLHLVPLLGKYELSMLKAAQIQHDLVKKLEENLSSKTVHNIVGTLSTALTQAVKWGYLHANPCTNVVLPKMKRQKDIRTGEAEQLRAILRRLHGRQWYLPTLIALYTGMRRGEVLGLRWEDYNAEQQTLSVRHALSRVKDSQIVEKGTKQDRAHVIAIGGILCRLLNRHRLRSLHTTPTDWICCKEDGRHLAPGGLTLAFARAAEKASAKLSFHGLRHTQATTLLLAGVPIKTVSDRLGHSTVAMTTDLYAHVLPQYQQAAAVLAERTILQKAKPDVSVL